MNEFFSRFQPEDSLMLFAIGSGLLISLVAIIGGLALKIVKSNNETRLKAEMLARGMSAEDIKTVLKAGTKRPSAMKIGCKE